MRSSHNTCNALLINNTHNTAALPFATHVTSTVLPPSRSPTPPRWPQLPAVTYTPTHPALRFAVPATPNEPQQIRLPPPRSPTPPRWPHLPTAKFTSSQVCSIGNPRRTPTNPPPPTQVPYTATLAAPTRRQIHSYQVFSMGNPQRTRLLPAQVPDTATLAVLKQAIHAKLAIPMDDMLLSKQPGLLTSKEPYSFRDMGINDASLKWVTAVGDDEEQIEVVRHQRRQLKVGGILGRLSVK